jgi:hypothetical protein
MSVSISSAVSRRRRQDVGAAASAGSARSRAANISYVLAVLGAGVVRCVGGNRSSSLEGLEASATGLGRSGASKASNAAEAAARAEDAFRVNL